MAEASPGDLRALQNIAEFPSDEPFAERLEKLEAALAANQVRKVGTNIVALSSRMTDTLIRSVANYSIIDSLAVIDEDSSALYSYIGVGSTIAGSSWIQSSSVGSYSEVSGHSKIKRSTTTRSTIDNSHVEDSAILENTNLEGATVEQSTIGPNSWIEETWIQDSVIENNDVVGDEVRITDGDIRDKKHLINFGQVIGRGNPVYAYRTKEDELRIKAGCKRFDSVEAMLEYAKNAPEYAGLDAQTRASYLRQIETMAVFMTATRLAWPKDHTASA